MPPEPLLPSLLHAPPTSREPFIPIPVCYSGQLGQCGQPVQGQEVSKRLLSLKQGAYSVADFAINFRIWASETGWDVAALQGVFLQGLEENIQDELAARDDASSLEQLI